MKVKIEIECSGDAFWGKCSGVETRRILRKLADDLPADLNRVKRLNKKLIDINGNKCGKVEFS